MIFLPFPQEASLVRLVLYALQGVQSAVVSIEQLSAMFSADPADRTGHRIPTLWNRSLSTFALRKMLKSIGFTGCLVVLLHKFVDYYTCSSFDGTLNGNGGANKPHLGEDICEDETMVHPPYSLVNQAFAVAVRTVLKGYVCALDTLNASAHLRRSFDKANSVTNASGRGSLTSISHSEVTLLEIYAHTKELRTRIEGLGQLCRLCDSALCFALVPFEDLLAKAVEEIHNFYKGGSLLTYLYEQLQVVDPTHYSLLKFLFLRSLEPYCRFIRSWIYEAKISDPYGEFIVECAADSPSHLPHKAGAVDFQLATVREQNGVVIPCFLVNVLVQLLRAGQQLQVVMKLLRLCNYAHAGEDSFEDILPSSSDFPSHVVSGYPLSFDKGEIEAIILSRKEFYCKMHEKLEKFMDTIDIKYRQIILHDANFCTSYNTGKFDVQHSFYLDDKWDLPSAVDESNFNQAAQSTDSEASSIGGDFSYALQTVDSSECSSTDGSEDEQVDATQSLELHDSLASSTQKVLSSLVFFSLSSDKALPKATKVQETSCMQNLCVDISDVGRYEASFSESVEPSRFWLSEMQYAGALPNLGWPFGGLLQNPLSIKQRCREDRSLIRGVDKCISVPGVQLLEDLSFSSNQPAHEHINMHEAFNEPKISSSHSFLAQSWNTKHPTNVLSMNPMLTKTAFLQDVKKDSGNISKISLNFPCLDFSVPSNPLKVRKGQFSADQRREVGSNVLSLIDYGTSGVGE